AFGNLIRERRGRAQTLVTEYRYDSQHRLIGLTRPDGQTASYRYDAFGRRISKTVNGETTEFFWQGEHLVAESSENEYRGDENSEAFCVPYLVVLGNHIYSLPD
ncbi:MAG: RHS repeat protein, partial [Ilumatobacteraceae bacterium]|nr:RHS repeat protein [Ilumatobacteraceae bacterium]